MDFEEQFINPEPEVTDMSKGHVQDYSMILTSISIDRFATRNVEEGNIIEFFDKCTVSYLHIRIHRNDHQTQMSNIIGSVNQEYPTTIAFQLSAQQYDTHKRGKQCTKKSSRTQQKTSICQPSHEPNMARTGLNLNYLMLTQLRGTGKIAITRNKSSAGDALKLTNSIKAIIPKVCAARGRL
ncbi:hypothetical protein Cgig2_033366 [Carnegiea gigantea]|uniref:Uncharacterized protein n=1 Tax=Carnegiea gigantea TaxID=171969 RepID=A0A9Q1KVB8_9CARY|nr:hypothetical protein Cgig2_033366 [Carnegiea gigantea]